MQKIPSYIRDTTDFINKLESVKNLPPSYFLVTLDVTSLYTNIPNHEGLTSVARTLNRHKPAYRLSYQSILSLLRLVLHCNNFSFEGKNYLQIGGTAMGTKLAPSYANIFMGELEKKMLQTAPHQPYIYLRYINDIFIIWTGTLAQLHEFYDHCNNFHHMIKFTVEFSQEQITFLDTIVRRTDNGAIEFDLYCKPTDKHCYLHYQSNHPDNQKRAGPFSQFLLIRRICSKITDFDTHAQNLIHFFERRGYPKNILEKSLKRARETDRTNLLRPSNTNKTVANRIPFVLTHDWDIHNLKKAVLRMWPILNINHPVMFANPPIFAFKIGRKISQSLVRAEFSTKTRGQKGVVYKNPVQDCITANCKHCALMNKSKVFTSTYTKYKYKCALRGHCTTRNVVYLVTCELCKQQYVGETKREIKVRMTEHQRDTRNHRDTPVANHFNLNNHSPQHMKFQIIEILASDPDSETSTVVRRKKELHWIYQLHTLRPVGINVQG